MDSRDVTKLLSGLKDIRRSIDNQTEVIRAGQRQPDLPEPPLEGDILPCVESSEQELEDKVIDRLIKSGAWSSRLTDRALQEPIFEGDVPVYIDYQTPVIGKAQAFRDEQTGEIRIEIDLPSVVGEKLDDLMGPSSTRALTFVPTAGNPKRENI